MSCSALNIKKCFGGTCWLHIQGRRIGQARNQLETGKTALDVFFDFEEVGDKYLRNVG
jgi:hypothetical protein